MVKARQAEDINYTKKTEWDKNIPSKEIFDIIFKNSNNQIIWGGNYFTDYLNPSMGWIVWDKGQRNFSLADGELAWTSYNKALRIFTVSRAKALQDGKQHPTQKSKDIMLKCLTYAGNIESVLDPFFGSGTTGLACEKLNIKWTGIEISEKYCEIAKQRISHENDQLKMEFK